MREFINGPNIKIMFVANELTSNNYTYTLPTLIKLLILF